MDEGFKVIQRGTKRRAAASAVADVEPPKKKRGRPTKERVIPDFVQALTAGQQIEQVPLDQIDLTDTSYRFRVSIRVKDLVESIRQHGQQMPAILRRRDGHEQLQIVSGFRRTTAVSQIGWTTVSAIILDSVSEEDAFRISVLENEKRKTYSDLDRAYAIHKYRQMGLTVSNIAEEVFGLSRKQVERIQKLTDLPTSIQEAIADDRISTTAALVLQQVSAKHQDKVDLDHWVERIEKDGLSVNSLRSAVLKSLADEGDEHQPDLFVSQQAKDGGHEVLRFRPVRLDPKAMSAEQRAQTATALRRALALVEGAEA